MNFKRTIYLLIVVTTIGLQSCLDILDTAPYNQVASNNMWSNPSLTNQGVAGIYENMRNWGVYGAASYGLNVVPFECLGVTGEAYRSIPYLNGTAGPGDAFFSNMWKTLYEGVHRANDAIYNLAEEGSGGVDEITRTRLLAESKFLRAYYYMRLNELYGKYGLGVPLYTEPLSSVEDATKTQSSEEEIWNQIIQDLTDCIDEPNFPLRYIEKGRASKGAAYALRGRAFLMRGAIYNYNNNSGVVESTTINKEQLQNAVQDFSKVKECGFDLFQGGYAEMFTEANEDCIEMIFSIHNISRPGYGSSLQLRAGTRSAGDITGSTGWSQYSASPAIVDLYEYKDGSPFNWNDVIPNYYGTPEKDRLVYYIRDKEKNGVPVVSNQMSTLIDNKLNPLPTKSEYLPEGNEARLSKAWENRDPRFYANLIVPYGDVFLGTDANLSSKGNFEPVPYIYRWPVGAANQSVEAQTNLGISAPYDLRQDGTAEAEFAFRHRKFVMKGYEAEYIEHTPIDEPIVRYAYVLTMWAEALIHLDDLTGAADKINLIRGRESVEMPDYTFVDKDDALIKLRNESRREFVNESVNFYEEFRWGTLRQTKYSRFMNYDPAAHTCMGTQSNGNGIISWSSTNDFSIFPVPSTEIEKNDNLIKTPGWIY